jgi:hypothetical protein
VICGFCDWVWEFGNIEFYAELLKFADVFRRCGSVLLNNDGWTFLSMWFVKVFGELVVVSSNCI